MRGLKTEKMLNTVKMSGEGDSDCEQYWASKPLPFPSSVKCCQPLLTDQYLVSAHLLMRDNNRASPVLCVH